MGAGWKASVRRTDGTSGYRASLIGGAIACAVTLIINLSLVIWAAGQPDLDGESSNGNNSGGGSGRRVLYEGSCRTSKDINTGLHLLINVMSSVLLSTSNYGLQCLSAPTRDMVNKAHTEGTWLDIGIVSVRNLRRQTALTRVLWMALILSSVPLHLLYNSVIFSSLTVPSSYYVFYLDEPIARSMKRVRNDEYESLGPGRVPAILSMLEEPESLDNLTVSQCIDQYGVSFLTDRDDVVLVQEAPDEGEVVTGEYIQAYYSDETFSWICQDLNLGLNELCQPRLEDVKANTTGWWPHGRRVKYCLSRPKKEQLCRVSVSIAMAIGVIVSNGSKLAILIYIATCLTPARLFVLGDAIQSFLSDPDNCSRQSCLVSVDDVRIASMANGRSCRDPRRWRGPRTFTQKRHHWMMPVGVVHFGFCVLLYSGTLIACLAFLIWGILVLDIPHTFQSLWSLGFGQADLNTTISWSGGGRAGQKPDIASNVVVANLPHLSFSILYFQWNNIMTLMSLAREWSGFWLRGTTLRVSSKPQGEQRSRYFLQLPYRFSIPLIGASILIHWLLSQSLFVVSIETVDVLGQWESWVMLTFGYSPLAIIALLSASTTIPLSLYLVGRQRLPGYMPVAGSCSLAIAAACHPPEGDRKPRPEAALHAVAWGVMAKETNGQQPGTDTDTDRPDDETEAGQSLLPSRAEYAHCGFSDDVVDEPQEGVMYA